MTQTATRLNASPETAARPMRARHSHERACLECGTAFASPVRQTEFCGSSCRQAFNNRRLQRGGEFYDLIMAQRYDRHAANRVKAWTFLCRMARAFREEDLQQRAGRKSWRNPRAVIDRHAHLYAQVLVRARPKPIVEKQP